jgi:cytochrome c oxidase cbb3-type subunit IV
MIAGIATAVMLVAFAGVCAWAWSVGRRGGFDEAARMPLEDESGDGR